MEGMKIETLLRLFGLKRQKQVEFYRPGSVDLSLTDKQVLHEVAHFQVASPSRRLLVNFGMGDDTMGMESVLSPVEHVREETRAILLTLFWYEELGIKEESPSVSFRFRGYVHNVDARFSKQNKTTRQAFDWLLETNLLDHNLRPDLQLNEKRNK
jgi:hypothetical protein